jgi:hypothetical protein
MFQKCHVGYYCTCQTTLAHPTALETQHVKNGTPSVISVSANGATAGCQEPKEDGPSSDSFVFFTPHVQLGGSTSWNLYILDSFCSLHPYTQCFSVFTISFQSHPFLTLSKKLKWVIALPPSPHSISHQYLQSRQCALAGHSWAS